jgi:NADH:ubiquinone oxidoreductase subunit K
MADLGLFGGVLFAVSTYGFLTRRNWAFFLSVVALVLVLLGSWFVNPYPHPDLFHEVPRG